MGKIFHSAFLTCSILVFIISCIISFTAVSGEMSANKAAVAKAAPAKYNPLQILPPGVTPEITPLPTPEAVLGFATERLEGTDLAACQTFSKTFVSNANEVLNGGIETEKRIIALAQGGAAYYLNVATGSGGLMASYPNLLANSIAKQEAAEGSLNTLAKDINEFSCFSDNPSGQLLQYDTDARISIAAIASHKASVQSLMAQIMTALRATILPTQGR